MWRGSARLYKSKRSHGAFKTHPAGNFASAGRPAFPHCSFCHVTTNPEPKRLNLAFREWSVSGNCSHPVYVVDFLTSNRIWLVSPLVKSAFSASEEKEKGKTLRVGHSLGRVINKYKCTALRKFYKHAEYKFKSHKILLYNQNLLYLAYKHI